MADKSKPKDENGQQSQSSIDLGNGAPGWVKSIFAILNKTADLLGKPAGILAVVFCGIGCWAYWCEFPETRARIEALHALITSQEHLIKVLDKIEGLEKSQDVSLHESQQRQAEWQKQITEQHTKRETEHKKMISQLDSMGETQTVEHNGIMLRLEKLNNGNPKNPGGG